MRTEFVITKARPIKKLFIINDNDLEAFKNIFTQIQSEIDYIRNLIFINNEELFSKVNKEFISRADIDIIINLSSADNGVISSMFNTKAVTPSEHHHQIKRYGTHLYGFNNLPNYFSRMSEDLSREVFISPSFNNSDMDIFKSINFGLDTNDLRENLELSVFEKIKLSYSNDDEVIENLFNCDTKFNRLTTEIADLGAFGRGTSIHSINYNTDNHFEDSKKYIFVSESDGINMLTYFWNTRSYYYYKNIAWIPVSLLGAINKIIDEKTVFVYFDEETKKTIVEKYKDNEIFMPTQLYFKGAFSGWNFFKQTHTIAILNEKIIVHHPLEKTFSSTGLLPPFILEVRGLKEFSFPKKRTMGDLYFNTSDLIYTILLENFTKLTNSGLAKYIVKNSQFDSSDIAVEIFLPSFENGIENIFKDSNYKIKETQKTLISKQSLNLLKNLDNLELICNEKLFNILLKMVPKSRKEQIEKLIAKKIGDEKKLSKTISDLEKEGSITFPQIISTTDEIFSTAGGSVRKMRIYNVKHCFLLYLLNSSYFYTIQN